MRCTLQWVALYQDLPNRQLKVKVADRTAIDTTDAGQAVLRHLSMLTSMGS